MKKTILFKLHTLGAYGARSLTWYALCSGYKDVPHKEIRDALVSLLLDGVIIITNLSGCMSIALDPKMKDKIREMLR